MAAIPNLKKLFLTRTKITDSGLRELNRCKNIADLSVQNTKVTDAGLKDLKAALPKVNVSK